MISISAEERIGRRAAVHAGVQIGLGAHRFDFGIDQAAQSDAQSGEIGRKQFGVADQREIGLQLCLFLAHIGRDRFAANFFFAFDDELHIQRQLAVVALHQGFDGFDFHPELAFVVDCAASVNVVVALGGLERRRDPLVERVGRLHVVMRVAQHGRLAGSVQPVGIDQRMALGRNGFDVLQPDAPKFGGHELGRLLHVGLVLLQRADAGDAEQVFQFVEETLLIAAGIIDCGRGHGRCLSEEKTP